ncbi:MAG: hypothetical protein II863_17090 [Kiritimatiellae bacterium]|nr:hypothetical protein [Kiritimatiellia bacterium]
MKSWIIDRERTGRPCFSRDEVAGAFPSLSASSIDSSLSRFRSNGLIQAVHRGFYCVIPAHYAYVGKVPPAYYMDELMKWLGRPYYIALLSAAEMFGAAHQKPMVTQVMTELPCFSYSKKKNDSVDWQFRSRVPSQFVLRRNGENGQIAYSNAELTAVDLVRYSHSAGGLSSVATVLAELRETTDFNGAGQGVFKTADLADVQRLGYIYDAILGDGAQSERIHDELLSLCRDLKPVVLNPGLPSDGAEINRRWKVRINHKIEMDEV